jgi:hypothetical protein
MTRDHRVGRGNVGVRVYSTEFKYAHWSVDGVQCAFRQSRSVMVVTNTSDDEGRISLGMRSDDVMEESPG